MSKQTLASVAILLAAIAAFLFVGESDYQHAKAQHEERCERMELFLNDQHLEPKHRRGWPESYPGQFAAECGEESER